MSRLVQVLLVSLSSCMLLAVAHADVWRWVDANGETHYVDSDQAIYTWKDAQGKVHYSDKPDHEDAVRVQLFWHAQGSLADLGQSDKSGKSGSGDTDTGAGDIAEPGSEREKVVAQNCKRASEILAAYENAPKLYRTDENGTRHILTEAEYAAEVEDARAKTRFLCSQ